MVEASWKARTGAVIWVLGKRSEAIIDDLDLNELRRLPRISYYFRYALHRHDFHDLKVGGRLRGHYAAKPLYGALTPEGRVDRAAGFNGAIAALFVPMEAVSVADVMLFLTHIAPMRVTLPGGRRNWPAIRQAAEDSIRETLSAGGS